ncbi:hypothetical protein AUJ65_00560 [Candidatus Micrarchaeota archaeon CG1_02_51_15]|nr:MAG: hypothetical protein AUJ65_00560 [Candidatus Micrarchaeota archaeon CG1_02_51_15]
MRTKGFAELKNFISARLQEYCAWACGAAWIAQVPSNFFSEVGGKTGSQHEVEGSNASKTLRFAVFSLVRKSLQARKLFFKRGSKCLKRFT